MELPGGVFPGIIRVQGSPFRVGKRRVRDINHEGHEEHEVKRWIILIFLNLQVLHALHGEKFFVL